MSDREPCTYTLRLAGVATPAVTSRSITSVMSASMVGQPRVGARRAELPAPALPGSGSAVGGLEPPSQPGPTELPHLDGTPPAAGGAKQKPPYLRSTHRNLTG